MKSHSDEIKSDLPSRPDLSCNPLGCCQGSGPQCGCTHFDLHETGARTWKSFFEQLQCIIVIQNLDRVCQCDQLIGTSFRACLPLRSLRCATTPKLCKKLLIGRQCFLSVTSIVFHLCQGHAKLPLFGELRLYLGRSFPIP